MRICTSVIWRGSRVNSGSIAYGRSATTTKSTHEPGISTRGSLHVEIALTCAMTMPWRNAAASTIGGVSSVFAPVYRLPSRVGRVGARQRDVGRQVDEVARVQLDVGIDRADRRAGRPRASARGAGSAARQNEKSTCCAMPRSNSVHMLGAAECSKSADAGRARARIDLGERARQEIGLLLVVAFERDAVAGLDQRVRAHRRCRCAVSTRPFGEGADAREARAFPSRRVDPDRRRRLRLRAASASFGFASPRARDFSAASVATRSTRMFGRGNDASSSPVSSRCCDGRAIARRRFRCSHGVEQRLMLASDSCLNAASRTSGADSVRCADAAARSSASRCARPAGASRAHVKLLVARARTATGPRSRRARPAACRGRRAASRRVLRHREAARRGIPAPRGSRRFRALRSASSAADDSRPCAVRSVTQPSLSSWRERFAHRDVADREMPRERRPGATARPARACPATIAVAQCLGSHRLTWC